jgi:hypothetical protein
MKVPVFISQLIQQGCLLLGVLALNGGVVFGQVEHQYYSADQRVEPFDLFYNDGQYTVRTRAGKDDFVDYQFTPGGSAKAAPTPLIFSGFSPFQAVRQRNNLTLTYYSDWSGSIKSVLYEEDIRKVWHFNKQVISTPGATNALVKLTTATSLDNGDYLLAGILKESIQGVMKYGLLVTMVSANGKQVWQTRKSVPSEPVSLKLHAEKSVHYLLWESDAPLASSALTWIYPNGSWSSKILELPIPCQVNLAVNSIQQLLITGHNFCDTLGTSVAYKAICIDTTGNTLWSRTGWEAFDKTVSEATYAGLSAHPMQNGWMIFGRASKLHSLRQPLPYVFALELDIYGDMRNSNIIPVRGVTHLIATKLPQKEWLVAYSYPTDSLHQEVGLIHWNEKLEVRETEHPWEKSLEYLTQNLPVVLKSLDSTDHLNGEYLLQDGPVGVWIKLPMQDAQPVLIPSFTCLPRPDNASQLTCMVQLCATNGYSIAKPSISLQTLPGWKFITKEKQSTSKFPLKYFLPNIKKSECLAFVLYLEQVQNQNSPGSEAIKKTNSDKETFGFTKSNENIIIVDDVVWTPIQQKNENQEYLASYALSKSPLNDLSNGDASEAGAPNLRIYNKVENSKSENIIIVDDVVWKPGNSGNTPVLSGKTENIIIVDDVVWREQHESTKNPFSKSKSDNIIIVDDVVWRSVPTPEPAPLDPSNNSNKTNQYHSYSTQAGSMIRLLAEQPFTGAIQVFDSQGQSLGQLNCHRNYLYVPPDLATGTYIMRTGTGYVFRLILK